MLKDHFVTENDRFTEMEDQIVQHNATFIWTDFNVGDFNGFQHKKQASMELSKQIDHKNTYISEQRLMLEKQQETLEKYKKALEKFKLDEAEKQAHINQNLSNLKILNYEDFKQFSAAEIKKIK